MHVFDRHSQAGHLFCAVLLTVSGMAEVLRLYDPSKYLGFVRCVVEGSSIMAIFPRRPRYFLRPFRLPFCARSQDVSGVIGFVPPKTLGINPDLI